MLSHRKTAVLTRSSRISGKWDACDVRNERTGGSQRLIESGKLATLLWKMCTGDWKVIGSNPRVVSLLGT